MNQDVKTVACLLGTSSSFTISLECTEKKNRENTTFMTVNWGLLGGSNGTESLIAVKGSDSLMSYDNFLLFCCAFLFKCFSSRKGK